MVRAEHGGVYVPALPRAYRVHVGDPFGRHDGITAADLLKHLTPVFMAPFRKIRVAVPVGEYIVQREKSARNLPGLLVLLL